MLNKKQFAFTLALIVMLVTQPLAAFACATCGCSELCPLTMVEDTNSINKAKGSLSDSLWGSIILKIAYQRDPEIQKLTRHINGMSALTEGTTGAVIGGTLSQNIVSMAVLRHPDGVPDSYLPTSLGLGFSGLFNVVFDSGLLFNWRLKSKIKTRLITIRNRVEIILDHLEYSQTACPQAQADLKEIIGERAASDCIQLWQSSHAIASVPHEKTLSQTTDDGNVRTSLASINSELETNVR